MKVEKLKNHFKSLIVLFLILIVVCIFFLWVQSENYHQVSYFEEEPVFQETNMQKEVDAYYQNCLASPYVSEKTRSLIQEFLDKYQNDTFAVYFEDIHNQYTILKNENTVYYGASLIKLLDATYLTRQAMADEISLEETIEYQAKHQRAYSIGMTDYHYGDKVRLYDLIYYAIAYSDNTAHEMLYEYIGVETLREYASSLGVSLTVNQEEHFGNLTVTMANNILKEVYDILLLDNEYSELLLKSMNNTYFNSLNYDGIEILHKYGSLDPNFHDIGIYNDSDYPYFISVMSLIGEQESPNQITTIHQEIRDIYKSNLLDKTSYCLAEKEEYESTLAENN